MPLTVFDTSSANFLGIGLPGALILVLSALLAMQAAPALLVASGRLAEAASWLLGRRMDATRRNLNRTGDHPQRAGISIDSILATEAAPLGNLIFAYAACKVFLGAAAPVIPGVREALTPPAPAALPALEASALSAHAIILTALANTLLSGVVGAWRSRTLGAMAVALRYALLALIAVFIWVSKLDLAALLMLGIAFYCLRSPIMIAVRGVQIHGAFAPLWYPGALLAWLVQAMAHSILGPATMLLPGFLTGRPPLEMTGCGKERARALQRETAAVPLCYPIDTLEGATRPT